MVMKMGARENARIRDQILDLLYAYEKDNPGTLGMDRIEILKQLNIRSPKNIEENIMDFNMLYLADKHLVKLEKVADDTPWRTAKITAYGIDHVEKFR